MIYKNYKRNHVIYPGREKALDDFINSTVFINGKNVKHKLRHSISSNSEDALTWSCFDVLRQLSKDIIDTALDEIMEDAFGMEADFSFKDQKELKIDIGKSYHSKNESGTELDASIETKDKIIFFEAKLYSGISLENDETLFDQIIKKLRVGLEYANETNKEFYFIFLDIAPIEYISKFGDRKSISAIRFDEYKKGGEALEEKLKGISYEDINKVTANMGWLTWACLFKTVLRATIKGAKF